jgi:hypothetical protein
MLELSNSIPLPIFSKLKQNEYINSSINPPAGNTQEEINVATVDRATEAMFTAIANDDESDYEDNAEERKMATEEDIQIAVNQRNNKKAEDVCGEEGEESDKDEPDVANQPLVEQILPPANANTPLIDITRNSSIKNKENRRVAKPKKSALSTDEKLIQAARKIASASKNILHSNSFI